MATAVPIPTARQAPVRHRRDVQQMTAGQLADFREAIRRAQGLTDERGYQYWTGLHGLPLPMYCRHGSPLFLYPDADQSSGRDHPGHAGSFTIFGHGNCFGEEGHCEVPEERERLAIYT